MKKHFGIASVIMVLIAAAWLMPGCFPQRNRPPSVAEVSCPSTAKVGKRFSISVVAYDRDRDKIAYKVAFGDGVQSEWSEFLPSGQAKVFHYTYSRAGIFGIYAIASDHHHVNSGWSEQTFIEVKPVVTKFLEIGTTRDTFFWAMIEFQNKLYAGTYKLSGPKAYSYPPWTYLKTFAAGESIMEFAKLDGRLYACSEKKGHIYRMNTPTDWVVVHDDADRYVLNIKPFKGYLYAYTFDTHLNSKVIRSLNGTSWSTVGTWSNLFLQDSFIYNDEFYLVGNKISPHRAWAKKTSDGTTWVDAPGLCSGIDGQWIAPVSGKGKVWIGMGEIPGGWAKIYKYDGATVSEVFGRIARQPSVITFFEDSIYALFTTKWRQIQTNYFYWSATGEAGTWNHIKTFIGKADARAMGKFNNELYLGIGNTVYKMIRE